MVVIAMKPIRPIRKEVLFKNTICIEDLFGFDY
jgi:hypothetical protein